MDYPNHLASPLPEKNTVARARWLLSGLVLICLVPRALMALKITAVCPDGALFIQFARELSQSDLQGGLSEMRLNTFPMLLMVLHRLGLDWELAGKWWGVAISSLVVLPLFGWARRQFDDRVALLACVLYAVHANLIEWSPEVIRGPTFWFLFMLSLYLLWRAMIEVRLGIFVAAGLTITLAALTRIEGLFLLMPLVCWSVSRWRALTESRGRLVLGAVLCVTVAPALLLLINVTWLRDHPHWEFSRLKPLVLVGHWFQSLVATAFGAGGSAAISEGRLSSAEMLWTYVYTLYRGLTAVFALLLFGGLWQGRRIWRRPDHHPISYVTLAVMVGIWIHLSCTGAASYRYPLPLVLMGSRFAALGLLGLSAWTLGLAERLQWGAGLRSAAVAAPLAIVCVIGLADALSSDCETQHQRLRLGRWLAEEFGPAPSLIGPEGLGRTAGHYAQGRFEAFNYGVGDDALIALAGQFKPDLILLTPGRLLPKAGRGKVLTGRMRRLGFEQVDPSRVPSGREDVFVFAHRRTVAPSGGGRLARSSSGKAR